MRLRFVAPGHEGRVCTVFGLDFAHGAWVEVEDPGHARRLAANPTFEAEAEVETEAGAETGVAPPRRPILRLPTPPADA